VCFCNIVDSIRIDDNILASASTGYTAPGSFRLRACSTGGFYFSFLYYVLHSPQRLHNITSSIAAAHPHILHMLMLTERGGASLHFVDVTPDTDAHVPACFTFTLSTLCSMRSCRYRQHEARRHPVQVSHLRVHAVQCCTANIHNLHQRGFSTGFFNLFSPLLLHDVHHRVLLRLLLPCEVSAFICSSQLTPLFVARGGVRGHGETTAPMSPEPSRVARST